MHHAFEQLIVIKSCHFWLYRLLMVINDGKCAIMLVSTRRYTKQSTPVTVGDQDRHTKQSTPVTVGDQDRPHVDSLRLLGLTLQNTLKRDLHVDNRVSKANSRKYFLLVLKSCGIGLQDLVKCYCTFVRSILEFVVQVRHPELTSGHSARECRNMCYAVCFWIPNTMTHLLHWNNGGGNCIAGFASELQESPELCDSLPSSRAECHGRNVQSQNKLTVLQARTQRFMCSPITCYTDMLKQ